MLTDKCDNELSKTVSHFLTIQIPFPDIREGFEKSLQLKEEELHEKIYQIIVDSEFRRTAVDKDTEADTRQKIKYHVKRDIPISFSLPFGAYKNWRLWSYPEPEWAEVFNINYMIRYIYPLAKLYRPGVIFNYSFGDNVMDIVSNMPASDTDRYIDGFKSLISFFQPHLPHNIAINAVCINQFYNSSEEHKRELQQNYLFNKANWESKYSPEIRMKKVDSARRNLMLRGVENLSGLTKEQLEARYLDSAMWCDAHDCLRKRREFNKYGTNIEIANIRGPSLALNMGSCDTSTIHFWVGAGVVEIKNSRLRQRIMSQPSLDEMLNSGAISFVDVDNPFKSLSAVFNKIPVWNK